MSSWDEQVTTYEAKIAKLEAEAVAYVKTANQAILISGAIGVFLGLVIGIAL